MESEEVAPRGEGRRAFLVAVILLVLTALFFLATARRDLEASDSAELVASSYSLGIPHATGYPLYTWLGRIVIVLLPFDPARDMNLLSAIFGGAALLLFAFALRELTGRLLSAAAAIAGLALSRPLWFVATIAEVYTLHLLLIAATCFFLFRWGRRGSPRDLLLAVYLAALGLSHHGSTAILLPGYLFFVLLGSRSIREAARHARLLLLVPLALTVYLHHPIRHRAHPAVDSFDEIDQRVSIGLLDRESVGETFLERFRYKVLGGGPARKMTFFGEEAIRQAASFPALFRSSVGSLFALGAIAGLGVRILRRPREGAMIAWALLANTLLFLNLRTEDLEDFLVPSFLFLASGAAFLIETLRPAFERTGKRRSIGALLLIALFAWNAMEIAAATERSGGYRHSAPTLPRERALLQEAIPSGSAILLPWGRATVLRYLQFVEGIRPDLRVFSIARNQIDRAAPVLIERGPLFADDAGEETRRRYSVSPFGPLLRIEKREAAGVSR
jgi:hypothetical protein